MGHLKPDSIIRGALLNEPVQVIAVVPMGDAVKIYGKAVIMSAEGETSEIIRRRLFNWEPGGLSKDAEKTIAAYAQWAVDHRNQIPAWFPADHAREQFRASFPFHPNVLSVFQRKWQELPRFQQTRGVLRMLALWVSKAFSEGYRGDYRDALIGLGTAPLEDSIFRTAVFEQLGESRLEGAVTTDICGKRDSIAARLDEEASDDIKKARLHRKVMTTIFFESNGGQSKGEATEPEIRLAVGECARTRRSRFRGMTQTLCPWRRRSSLLTTG